MNRFYILMTVVVSALFSSLNASEIEIPKITASFDEFNVDAELSESVWQKARSIDIIYETLPAENTPAPVKTTAFVMEDGEYFYIAFIAEDPEPTQIRSFYRDRDSIQNDDRVGIKIDTYNDSKLVYELSINPFGVQHDAIENGVTGEDNVAWDGIWHSAGKVTATGYQVEVAIPLRMLNFNHRLPTQTWKIELLRFYPRDVRHRLSSIQINRQNPCIACQMSIATGFANASQSNNLTLVPSLVTGSSQQRDLLKTNSHAWNTDSSLEPSADIRWGITPDVSLNATLNPDFSQLEADEAQVSLNDTFALFFKEKRPFFLDNAEYFSSPLDLVYTRNVASPDGGIKLTARHDLQSFAFFAANDKSTTLIVPGNVSSDVAFLDQKSDNAVLRYRNYLTPQLTMGWISTLRQSDDYHNHVHGMDMQFLLTDQHRFTAQILQSDTRYPDFLSRKLKGEASLRTLETDLSDGSKYLDYQYENRNWIWYSTYQAMEKNFRADLGYQPQTDFNQQMHGSGYRWFSDSQWWNQIQIQGNWSVTHDTDGALLEKESEVEVGFRSFAQSIGFIGFIERDRVGSRLDGKRLVIDGNSHLYTEHLFNSGFEIQPYAGVFLGIEAEAGKKLDFRNNRIGNGLELAPELTWNMDEHFQIQARHIYRSLHADSAEVFSANLTDLRLSYQFSVRSYLRLTLIYSDIKQNPLNNFVEVSALSKSLGSQLLYSYKINPQTLFFAGYSDNAVRNDDVQDLTTLERSVFMKISYAWML